MKTMDRRNFVKAGAAAIAMGAVATGSALADELPALPAPAPDPENMFGVDLNINVGTIDEWLGRDDVVYRDVRMLFDPANYGAIGGDADLSATVKGFKIVPYPYLATLTGLPVEGAYDAETLYTLTWNEDGSIASAEPNYLESEVILKDLFPKDKAIFLMCGGGGYAGMTKSLLIFLGWDENKLYNIGGNWGYTGSNALELKVYPEDANAEEFLATWRADYAYIEFGRLHPVA